MMRHVLSTLLMLSAVATADDADPYREPALRELMAAVTFYVSFDEGLQPDLAAGKAYAPKIHGNYAKTRKQPEFVDGLLGRALVLGTGSAVYPTAGNAPFESRGAAAFWIKPLEWKSDKDGTSVFVLAGRHLIVERQGPQSGPDGRVRRHAGILCIGRGEKIQGRASTIMAPDLKNGEWYFIAVNWSWPRIEMSINGAAPHAKSTAGRPLADAFPRFNVGARGGSRALMDELLIFKRPLTPAEVRRLYRALRPAL